MIKWNDAKKQNSEYKSIDQKSTKIYELPDVH